MKTLATLAAVLALGTAATAYAEDAGDIRALQAAKISLVQAIQAAEKHQGGQAIDASIDDDSFKSSYEVTVVKDNRVYDVHVSGEDGSILGAREDMDD